MCGYNKIIVYEVKRRFSASATDGVVKQQLYENHSKYSSASEWYSLVICPRQSPNYSKNSICQVICSEPDVPCKITENIEVVGWFGKLYPLQEGEQTKISYDTYPTSRLLRL